MPSTHSILIFCFDITLVVFILTCYNALQLIIMNNLFMVNILSQGFTLSNDKCRFIKHKDRCRESTKLRFNDKLEKISPVLNLLV